MRKQIDLKIEIGDANYVKPGELFAELSADGTVLTAIKRRKDDLTFETIVETPVTLEDNKAVTAAANPCEVTPTSGKDAMKKATVTFPMDANKTQSYSIAALEAGSVEITPSDGKLGMQKVTITFTE